MVAGASENGESGILTSQSELGGGWGDVGVTEGSVDNSMEWTSDITESYRLAVPHTG